MANVKITELTALTNPASSDVLPIVDVGADTTKKVTIADLLENAGDGAAATPAFSFDNDKSVGMWRPGSEQLAFSTSGTTRLFIDSSGNIGVNTSNPAANLHVEDTGAAIYVDDPASTNPVRITQTGANAEVLNVAAGDIEFGLANDGNIKLVNGVAKNTRLIISGTGNCGIGTTNPAQKLHLSNAGDVAIQLQNNGTGGVNSAYFTKVDSDDSLQIKSSGGATTANITFYTGSTSERMRITDAGNVGIGTTTPATTLELRSDANAQTTAAIPALRITNSDGSALVNDITGSVEFYSLDTSDPNHVSGYMRAISETSAGVAYSLAFGTKSSSIGDAEEQMRIKSDGTINFANVQTFADDAAAGSGGLVSGDVYKTSTGDLKIKA